MENVRENDSENDDENVNDFVVQINGFEEMCLILFFWCSVEMGFVFMGFSFFRNSGSEEFFCYDIGVIYDFLLDDKKDFLIDEMFFYV